MAEVTEEELAEYRQLKAIRQAQQAAEQAGNAPRLGVSSRALLADGTTYDYTGAHPSHVDKEGIGLVPVLSVFNT